MGDSAKEKRSGVRHPRRSRPTRKRGIESETFARCVHYGTLPKNQGRTSLTSLTRPPCSGPFRHRCANAHQMTPTESSSRVHRTVLCNGRLFFFTTFHRL